MNNTFIQLPTEPTNLIFIGVAGTGKTHRLLEIQKLYDESIEASWDEWRLQQVSHYSWCDIVCAVMLLENRIMTVPEMMRHQLVKDKATANKRNDNVNQTLWVQLNKHAHPESLTVNTSQRSANYFFDKTESSEWFVLDEVVPMLSQRLADLTSLYDGSSQHQYAQRHIVSRSCLVSFHQSYGYDEFVEGIRPRINSQTGQMQYDIQAGAFLELCEKAKTDPDHRYAMLIDEINRANTAQVFGELMSVIEPTKRAGSNTPMQVRLAYSGRQFSVPSNVDIYATMNTQDRSLAVLDTAFRRRFSFVTCHPNSAIVNTVADSSDIEVDLPKMMETINQRLFKRLGAEAQLGQSYFMGIRDIRQLATRLHQQIIPQIIEYANISVGSSQSTELLMQVLYNKSTSEVLEGFEGSLFESLLNASSSDINVTQSSNKLDSPDASNRLSASIYSNSRDSTSINSASQNLSFNASFIKIASTAHDVESVNTLHEQYFLSAEPYQKLYLSE